MISENIYTPYFYIIRHTMTGMMYAGARWAKGCHPDEFMTLNGYTTSSNTINDIINQEGLDSFELLRIDTNCDGYSVYDYETLFLETNKCAESIHWLNGHNNDKASPIDSNKNKQIMLLRYGVENASQSSEIKHKKKKTSLKNYGVDHPAKSDVVKQKVKQKSLEKYGVESPNSSKIVQDNKKKALLEKYGVDNIFQSDKVKELIKETNILKYGYDNVSKSPAIKLKKHMTFLANTGYDHPSKHPFFSIIDTHKTFSKNILSKCFPEFKQFY